VRLSFCSDCLEENYGKPERTDILLIAIDSLRVDHLSSYGYHRLTTPRIDHFATEGVLK
jgi:arylsulfatase A-like enzyme